MLAVGALAAALACSGVLITGVALSGDDTRVGVGDPPPPAPATSSSPTDAPVADGEQESSADAQAPSAAPENEESEEPEEEDAGESQQDDGGDDDGGGDGAQGNGGPDGRGDPDGAVPGGDRGNGDGPGSAGGSGPDSGGGCEAGYSVAHEWSSGFQAEVTVSADASISGWAVTIVFPDGQTIEEAWNADVSGGGGTYTATDAGRNGSLSAGQSAGFGIIGKYDGDNGRPSVSCSAS